MHCIRASSCAVAVFTLAACQEAPTPLEPTGATQSSLAKGGRSDLAAEYARIRPTLIQAMSSRGGGIGVLFVQTTMTSGIFLFDGTALCGAFQANQGNGAFYRVNPDGTVTAKVSDAEAGLFYADVVRSYSGTGSFQFHATGVGSIYDTGIPGLVIVFVDAPYRGPLVARGVGRVVEDGTAGPSALVQCAAMSNPDGSTRTIDITLH